MWLNLYKFVFVLYWDISVVTGEILKKVLSIDIPFHSGKNQEMQTNCSFFKLQNYKSVKAFFVFR